MKDIKHWIVVVLAGLMGIIIGAVVSFLITSNVQERAFQIYLDHALSWEENEAVAKFKSDSPPVAIYAQERLIIYANRFKEMGILDESKCSKIIGFAEARKGFLYESMGEIIKSEEYFKRAVATLKHASITTDIKELKILLISSKEK